MSQIKKNQQHILLICCIAFGFCLLLGMIPGELKYIKYGCPALFFIISLPYIIQSKYEYVEKSYAKLFAFNLLLILFTSLIALTVDYSFEKRFVLEAYCTLSPLICAYTLSKYYNLKDHRSASVALLVFYVIYFILDNLSYGVIGLVNQMSISTLKSFLVDSESDGESHAGFVLGLLALFFLITKQHKLLYIALFFVLLSSKRIVYLGVLAGGAFFFMERFIDLSKRRALLVTLFVVVGLMVPIVLLLLANGTYDGWIEENTVVSTNQLTQGRSFIYSILIDHFGYPSVVGTGYGSTSSLIASSDEGIKLLHSDLLKLFYEFGLLGFPAWLLYNSIIFTKNKAMTILYIYFFVLLMTDNVYIYFDFLFVFYFLQIYCFTEKTGDPKPVLRHKIVHQNTNQVFPAEANEFATEKQ